MEVIREADIKDKVYWLFGYVDNKNIKALCKILELKCEFKKFKIIFKILPSCCNYRIHSDLIDIIEIDIRQNDCGDKFIKLMQKYFVDDIKFI